MTILTAELDAIKQSVADALVAELRKHGLSLDAVLEVTAVALTAIDDANTDPTVEERRAFEPGDTVEHVEAPAMLGKVVAAISTNGELHTVNVQWAEGIGSESYSPRELRLVKA